MFSTIPATYIILTHRRDPPPTLTAIYSEETKENLETWLKAFVARPAVWDACCDGHREVVRRGGEVVKWMSEVGGIKETNLDGAWKNCVAKGVSVESAEILQVSFCGDRSDELKCVDFVPKIGCASSSRLDVDATIIAATFQVANVYLHATRFARRRF